jgi:hypothetical protein
MNLGGLILEEAPARDVQGVFGAVVLSFALVPFQAWAAFKGLISKDEGPWFRTPKTGRVTDEVRHLRRLYMLRRWLTRRRGEHRWASSAAPLARPPAARASARSRWLGWFAIGVLALVFAGLAAAAYRAPVVSAAGNPLYLHGSGTAPGCAATTVDQAIGSRGTACQIQSQAGGVTTTWSFTGLPTQTVAAGVWTFTMYWTGGNGMTNDTVAIAAGVSAIASCAGFIASVPNVGSTWTSTYGSTGAHTTSPFTVSTSASQIPLVIPAGGSLCVSVTLIHHTGGKPSLVYDGTAGVGDTNVVPPSIVVPESLLGLVGLAAFVPIVVTRLKRRRA